jgi:hypothetical protein
MVLRIAQVRFPDGTIRYAQFETYSDTVSDDLYAELEPLPADTTIGWGTLKGEALPKHLDLALSAPEDLIVVRIVIELYGYDWPALFCPQRQQLVGPVHTHNARALQEACEMVQQDGINHLARNAAVDHGSFSRPELSSHTLCGQKVTGETVPFYFGDHRDLYEEWDNKTLCRACLLHEVALNCREAGYARL